MTNKQKLKTFDEIECSLCEEENELYEDEGKRREHSRCNEDEQRYEHLREAILSLQKEVDALSSQLKALQNPKDSEVELEKKLLKTKL